MNCIANNPVTVEDINSAECIFGPDIGSIKGKTTRTKSTPVVRDYIEIPTTLIATHKSVALCMDTMTINGLSFLTTVSKNIKYRTIEWLPNKTGTSYRSVLDNVFRLYNKAGFTIVTIDCNNEYKSIMNDIGDNTDVKMNYASAQEHVPKAECNI